MFYRDLLVVLKMNKLSILDILMIPWHCNWRGLRWAAYVLYLRIGVKSSLQVEQAIDLRESQSQHVKVEEHCEQSNLVHVKQEIKHCEKEVNRNQPNNQFAGLCFLLETAPDADNVDEKHNSHDSSEENMLYEVE
jgi:hypothetical protein